MTAPQVSPSEGGRFLRHYADAPPSDGQTAEVATVEDDADSRPPLECYACKKQTVRTDFVLIATDGSEDWAGKLYGHCLWCAYSCDNEFYEACGKDPELGLAYSKRLWRRRSNRQKALTGIVDNRGRQFSTLAEELLDAVPQLREDRRSLYKLIKQRLVAINTAALAAILKEREEAAWVAQAREVEAKRYVAMLNNLRDEADGIQVERIERLVTVDTQYFTTIFETVHISYVCRFKECGFYGSNSDWLKHESSYQFRCPRCAKRYRPFAGRHGASELHPFQKVLSIVDPVTQRILAVPTTWPDTAADEFLGSQALIEARKIHSAGNPEEEARFKQTANTELHNLLLKVGLPPTMQHFKGATIEARHILQPAVGYGPAAIQRLDEVGYRGAILPADLAQQPVFNQWSILCAGLASLILTTPASIRQYLTEVCTNSPTDLA